MHSFLRQATASQSRSIGPFLDDTDFKTAETGLTIANTDIKLMINGAASANKNSGGGTHRANGVYGVTFDATDTATVGEIYVSVVVSGALPVFATFVVLEEAVYDALFAASAPGYLQPTTAGRTLDVAATGEAGLDLTNILLSNASNAFGIQASGTLSGTHSSTTADLGTNAPSVDIAGMTLYVPARGVSAFIDSYNTGTGVATFSPSTAATLTNGDQYYVLGTPKASTGSPIPANVTQLGGDAQSATDLKDFADAGYDPATNKVQGVVLTDTVTTYTGNTPQTGDSYARIGANGAGLTALATQSSVNDLPTNAELATALDALPTAAENAAAVLSAAESTPIESNMKQINDVPLTGDGQPGTEFDV